MPPWADNFAFFSSWKITWLMNWRDANLIKLWRNFFWLLNKYKTCIRSTIYLFCEKRSSEMVNTRQHSKGSKICKYRSIYRRKSMQSWRNEKITLPYGCSLVALLHIRTPTFRTPSYMKIYERLLLYVIRKSWKYIELSQYLVLCLVERSIQHSRVQKFCRPLT